MHICSYIFKYASVCRCYVQIYDLVMCIWNYICKYANANMQIVLRTRKCNNWWHKKWKLIKIFLEIITKLITQSDDNCYLLIWSISIANCVLQCRCYVQIYDLVMHICSYILKYAIVCVMYKYMTLLCIYAAIYLNMQGYVLCTNIWPCYAYEAL